MPTRTTKRQIFANEYLVDHNATEAAIRAGYSEHTAQADIAPARKRLLGSGGWVVVMWVDDWVSGGVAS